MFIALTLMLGIIQGQATMVYCSGTAFWAVGNKRSTELDVLKVVAALFTAAMFLGKLHFCKKALCFQSFLTDVCFEPHAAVQQASHCMLELMLQASTIPTLCSQWFLPSVLCTIGSVQQVIWQPTQRYMLLVGA
jgi:hypothetical protein